MRKRSPLFGLPIAALAVASLSTAHDLVSQDLGSYIGVVDVLEVFDALPMYVEGQAALKKRNDEFNAALEERLARIQQLDLDILALPQGTQEHSRKTLELDLAQREIGGLRNMHAQTMQAEMARLTVATYDNVFKAIGEVAETKGLKLVLRKRREQPNIPEEFRLSNNDRRTVLYVAPELDLTQDVINVLRAKEEDQ